MGQPKTAKRRPRVILSHLGRVRRSPPNRAPHDRETGASDLAPVSICRLKPHLYFPHDLARPWPIDFSDEWRFVLGEKPPNAGDGCNECLGKVEEGRSANDD
jgi:hypothetical protein